MSNVDINVDGRMDGRTDGRTENRTPISHPATSRCDKNSEPSLQHLTAFVPKYFAIKMNLLLYRILNEQIDM